MQLGRYKPLEKIRNLALELTNSCNSNCLFCPRFIVGDKIPHATMETGDALSVIKRVYDEARNYGGLRRLNIGQFGEPTLHSGLVQVLDYCKKTLHIPTVKLTTNASLLSKDLAESLLQHLDIIQLSIEAIDKETYEIIRKGLHWEITFENIAMFHWLRDYLEAQTQIVIFPVICRENENQASEILHFWRQFADHVSLVKEQTRSSFSKRDVEPYVLSRVTSLIKLARHWVHGTSPLHCHDTFNVRADGTVPLCCLDVACEHVLGNVFEDSINDIFSGVHADSYRFQLTEGELPLICQQCVNRRQLWRG